MVEGLQSRTVFLTSSVPLSLLTKVLFAAGGNIYSQEVK